MKSSNSDPFLARLLKFSDSHKEQQKGSLQEQIDKHNQLAQVYLQKTFQTNLDLLAFVAQTFSQTPSPVLPDTENSSVQRQTLVIPENGDGVNTPDTTTTSSNKSEEENEDEEEDYCEEAEVVDFKEEDEEDEEGEEEEDDDEEEEEGHGKKRPRQNVNKPRKKACISRGGEETMKYIAEREYEAVDNNSDYRWRKYGEKVSACKNRKRSYYKCVYPSCPARKIVIKDGTNDCVLKVEMNGAEHNHGPGQFCERKKKPLIVKKEIPPPPQPLPPPKTTATTATTGKRKRTVTTAAVVEQKIRTEKPVEIQVQTPFSPPKLIKHEQPRPTSIKQQQQQQQTQPLTVNVPVCHFQQAASVMPTLMRMEQPQPQQPQQPICTSQPQLIQQQQQQQHLQPQQMITRQPPLVSFCSQPPPPPPPPPQQQQQQQLLVPKTDSKVKEPKPKAPSSRRRSSGIKPAADGYKWHKYGEKSICGNGGNTHKHYYRCAHPDCEARKFVLRNEITNDMSVTYSGSHCHPPETAV